MVSFKGLRQRGINPLLMGAVLATSPACVHWAEVEGYRPANIQYATSSIGEEVTEEDLKRTLDTVVASGLLDPSFVRELEQISFRLCSTKHSEFSGFYYGIPGKESIEIILDNSKADNETERETRNYRGSDAVETAFHELAHHYYANMLSSEEQENFRSIVLDYARRFNELQKELELEKTAGDSVMNRLTDGGSTLPRERMAEIGSLMHDRSKTKRLFERYGFTEETYENFKRFMGSQEGYRIYYGRNFEEMFYGTEAFAWLGEQEFFWKIIALGLKLIGTSDDPLDIAEREISDRELQSLNWIPFELRPFYRGFLNQKYFTSEQCKKKTQAQKEPFYRNLYSKSNPAKPLRKLYKPREVI